MDFFLGDIVATALFGINFLMIHAIKIKGDISTRRTNANTLLIAFFAEMVVKSSHMARKITFILPAIIRRTKLIRLLECVDLTGMSMCSIYDTHNTYENSMITMDFRNKFSLKNERLKRMPASIVNRRISMDTAVY